MNSTSKAMKRDMLKAAEGRLSAFPKKKRKGLARKAVDMYVARIRAEVKKGVVYVETNDGREKRST